MEVFPQEGRVWNSYALVDEASHWMPRPERNPESVVAGLGMRPGDEVVFARLDLAETLGIWRNATGRVVGIHPASGRAPTIDVKFEGHETLQEYLPAMFRRVN